MTLFIKLTTLLLINKFAVYQISSSELQRISISTSGAVFPRCSIDGKVEESTNSKSESNHVVLSPISPSTSNTSSMQVDDTSEAGDITIDSVRDHTNSSSPVPSAVTSTTYVNNLI